MTETNKLFELGKEINKIIYYNNKIKRNLSCGQCVIDFYKMFDDMKMLYENGQNYSYTVVNFYNVNFQGNHTAIQIKQGENNKIFFDPNFGIYFYDDKPLGITDILKIPPNKLGDYCYYVNDNGTHYSKNKESNFYLKDCSGSVIYPKITVYTFNFFYVHDYLHIIKNKCENVEFFMNIDLKKNKTNGIDPENLSIKELLPKFLAKTNEVINHTDPNKKPDYGYLFHRNGYFPVYSNFYLNITSVLNIKNLIINNNYEVVIKGKQEIKNYNNPQNIVLDIMNNNFTQKICVDGKDFTINIEFTANNTDQIVKIKNYNFKKLYIFYVDVID